MLVRNVDNYDNRKYYFQVGEEKHWNDISAFNAFCKDRTQKFEFVINSPNLYTCSWNKPPKTIQQYEDDFARYLCATYDDICIMYSGGTDSHAIVEAFMRIGARNIKITHQIGHTKAPGWERHREIVEIRHNIQRYRQWWDDHGWQYIELDHTSFDRDAYVKSLLDVRQEDNFTFGVDRLHGLSLEVLVQDENIVKHHMYKKPAGVQKGCALSGNEKPYVYAVNGMWVWRATSNQFPINGGWMDPEYDYIYFFMDNAMPEIQVAKAHAKIDEIENICRKNATKIQEGEDWNSYAHPYYRQINHAMGYRGICNLLDGIFSKGVSSAFKNDYNKFVKINNLDTVYTDMKNFFRNNIDSDFLNANGHPHGINTRDIPIRPISSDVLG